AILTFGSAGSDPIPSNVDYSGTITYNSSINSGSKSSFTCLIGYQDGATTPKYWFESLDGAFIVQTEGACDTRDYSADFPIITNLASDLSSVNYNSIYYDASNILGLPCADGYVSAIDAGYYFHTGTGNITVTEGTGCEEVGLEVATNLMFHHTPSSQSNKSFIMVGNSYNVWGIKNEALNIDVTEDWNIEFNISHPSAAHYLLQFNFNYSNTDLLSSGQNSSQYNQIRFVHYAHYYPGFNSHNSLLYQAHIISRFESEGSKIQLGYDKNNSRYFVRQFFMDGELYREGFQDGTPIQGKIPFYVYHERSTSNPTKFSGIVINAIFLP
ncbi:MAG: hypothetical protein ACI9W5_000486, partial [Ulvibacter sp.]